MKKQFFILFLFISAFTFGQSVKLETINPQKKLAFKGGEWLKFRMSYSNFFNAGFSTMEVKETKNLNKDAFHIIGTGKSTGIVSLFFKVKDDYQTFIYKDNLKPYRFIRKIDEGGYTKDKEITFDYDTKQATVKNNKSNTETKHPINDEIQDILSSLYFLRSQKLNTLKVGDEIELPMFFDQEIHNFKLLFLGEEVIKTKFGKVSSLAFRPMVQAGRVFKEQESVTVWISNDDNKIPLRIKASLAVGSLRADLDAFKGLAHPFNIIFDN
ncbi:DUF3108 domain-containing protein [Lutibacter sp.]|uniref:DUF3108 domain-containing protein n=1 Tax=Lutibacter sp. TaxID=1925666 RepID=UPI0034A03CCA